MSSTIEEASDEDRDTQQNRATIMSHNNDGVQPGIADTQRAENSVRLVSTGESAADNFKEAPTGLERNKNGHNSPHVAGEPPSNNGEAGSNVRGAGAESHTDDNNGNTSSGVGHPSNTLANDAVATSNNNELMTTASTPPPYEKLAQKNPKPTDHLSITIGPPIIVLFDVVFPCIIYYVWFDIHRDRWARDCQAYKDRNMTCPLVKPEYDEEILGWAIASFGAGEVYILIVRVWRLFKYRDLCAPLLSRSRWELDATSWVYGVSMICALIPFVVGSTLEIPELYLYSPGFLMGFLGIVMVCTLLPVTLPIGINSHARGTRIRPFVYYAAEDFIAVDGLQDREFRIRYNARYDASKGFRRMFLILTIWWILGVLVYLGCLSAVIWSLEFHYAFGLSLGVLFAYLLIWASASYYWVQIVMIRQQRAYNAQITKC